MSQQLLLFAAVDLEVDIEVRINEILACRRRCNTSGQAGEDVHLIRAQLLQSEEVPHG
ncbi:hypothetical protein ACCQ07_22175 (plasmid) [Xanthomonas sp. NCPPB 3583]|uniref:hypothetical protein n=1 Tax=Xanthomonas sp. NCPPB 3583 TaxID=487558 RepID=UPI0035589938